MEHEIYRVVSFEDSATQIIGFRPVLAGGLYGPLQDQKLFDQVAIDPEVHPLVWPNGADFDPGTLHDWPKQLDEMRQMVERWAKVNPLEILRPPSPPKCSDDGMIEETPRDFHLL